MSSTIWLTNIQVFILQQLFSYMIDIIKSFSFLLMWNSTI